MKVSKFIQNLEYMKTTYGDLEIEVQLENDDEFVIENVLYLTSDDETIFIQNFIF